MTIFKAVLSEALQGGEPMPVVTATNINLSFQNSGRPVSGQSNALSDGNFDMEADLEIVLINGQVHKSKMPPVNKRLAELETVIAEMNGNSPEKAKLEAELAIWQAMIESIQSAVSTALKANYELQNPIV